jgi:hypothetical protein
MRTGLQCRAIVDQNLACQLASRRYVQDGSFFYANELVTLPHDYIIELLNFALDGIIHQLIGIVKKTGDTVITEGPRTFRQKLKKMANPGHHILSWRQRNFTYKCSALVTIVDLKLGSTIHQAILP